MYDYENDCHAGFFDPSDDAPEYDGPDESDGHWFAAEPGDDADRATACAHCGAPIAPGASVWWIVDESGEPLDHDYCAERCAERAITALSGADD